MANRFPLWGQAGWASAEVVGETHYAKAIRALFDAELDPRGADITVPVQLIPDRSDKRDRNAVGVWSGTHLLGHLPRPEAARYVVALTALTTRGLVPEVNARITGREWGAVDGRPAAFDATVRLDLGEPHMLVPANAPPAHEYRLLPSGSAVQVTGQQQSLAALTPLLRAEGECWAYVTLHEIDGHLVEVRVGDTRVGDLSPKMSGELLPVLRHVADQGAITAARAIVKGNSGKSEVMLYVARVQDLPESWHGAAKRPAAVPAAGRGTASVPAVNPGGGTPTSTASSPIPGINAPGSPAPGLMSGGPAAGGLVPNWVSGDALPSWASGPSAPPPPAPAPQAPVSPAGPFPSGSYPSASAGFPGATNAGPPPAGFPGAPGTGMPPAGFPAAPNSGMPPAVSAGMPPTMNTGFPAAPDGGFAPVQDMPAPSFPSPFAASLGATSSPPAAPAPPVPQQSSPGLGFPGPDGSVPGWAGPSDGQPTWTPPEDIQPSWSPPEDVPPSWTQPEEMSPSWTQQESVQPSWARQEEARSGWAEPADGGPAWSATSGEMPYVPAGSGGARHSASATFPVRQTEGSDTLLADPLTRPVSPAVPSAPASSSPAPSSLTPSSPALSSLAPSSLAPSAGDQEYAIAETTVIPALAAVVAANSGAIAGVSPVSPAMPEVAEVPEMPNPHAPIPPAPTGIRFAVPQGWPTPPEGWYPPEGWIPDPAWPPAPADWQWWVPTWG